MLFLAPLRRAIAIVPALLQLGAMLFGHADLRAQDALRVHAFTTEHGLASNTIQGIAQDRAGFIWVATRYGLQRFDGRTFVPYAQLHPSGPRELSEAIADLVLDARGYLWALTPSAFMRIDLRNWSVVRIPIGTGMGRYAVDSAGRLWFTERQRLHWVDADRQPVVIHDITTAASNKRSVLNIAGNGNLWLADNDTLAPAVLRTDVRTGQIVRYDIGALRGINSVAEDGAGRVWLNTEHGLALLDSATRTFRVVEPFTEPLRTTLFVPDGNGGLLFASDYWLMRIDTGKVAPSRWTSPDVFGRGVLPSRVMADREGAYWIGTTTAGLLRVTIGETAFRHYASRSKPPLPFASDFVMGLRERADGTLWVGTLRGGAYRVSADWRRVDVFRSNLREAGSLPSDEIWDFEEDTAGNLWVLTGGGLCRMERDRFRCVKPPGAASDMTRDSAGHFWLALGGRHGFVSFDPATGSFGHVMLMTERLREPIALFASPDSNYLWIAGVGVGRVRVRAGKVIGPFEMFIPITNAVPPLHFHFYRDRAGRLWLGSLDGLMQWDGARGRFVRVPAPGLRSTTVFSIGEDRAGRLWLGTAHGLIQYTAHTGATRRFTEKDGFYSGELNRRAALLRRNGEMLFGGVNGLTQFDPDRITGVREPPPILFTRWRKFTSRGVVAEPIDGVDALDLRPDDRAFTIEFTALTYAPGANRRFRYQLTGLSSGWVETSEPIATFQKPRPGRYTLWVQSALGADGGWSEPGAAMRLDVIPPFWATTFFRVFALLLVIGLVWSAHRLRLRQAVAAEQLRLRISRDLHDDIGAGLSSIALISDAVGSESDVGERERDQLRRIGDVARGLVADLRDIIWAIDPDRDRLTDIVTRMKDVAAALLPGVEVTFHMPAHDELPARVPMSSRRDLLLLYKEILHNIAKHAEADRVRIELVTQPGRLTLTVSDNGKGFSAAAQNGAGTGLKSVQERARRLGGDLVLSSRPGGGTSVQLTLEGRKRVMRRRHAPHTVRHG